MLTGCWPVSSCPVRSSWLSVQYLQGVGSAWRRRPPRRSTVRRRRRVSAARRAPLGAQARHSIVLREPGVRHLPHPALPQVPQEVVVEEVAGMASNIQSDTSLWLHNKLGELQHLHLSPVRPHLAGPGSDEPFVCRMVLYPWLHLPWPPGTTWPWLPGSPTPPRRPYTRAFLPSTTSSPALGLAS